MASIRTVAMAWTSLPLMLSLAGCGGGAPPDADRDAGVAPIDEDADGYPAEDDCDDGDPEVHPGAIERPVVGAWHGSPVVGGSFLLPFIAVEPGGAIHLVFRLESEIRHAILAPGSSDFSMETILEGDYVDVVGFELDAENLAHIVTEDSIEAPRYIVGGAGDWSTESFLTDRWELGSLSLDANGRPWLVGRNEDTETSSLWERTDDGWLEVRLEGAAASSGRLSLALATDGVPHLAVPEAAGRIEHVWREGADWRAEEVQPSDDRFYSYPFGGGASIEVGPDDSVRVTYRWTEGEPGSDWWDVYELRVRERAGGGWRDDVVLSPAAPLYCVRLVTGPSGDTRLLYDDWGILYHATDTGSGWVLEQIEDVSIAGAGCDLAVDAFGVSHVVAVVPLPDGTREMRYYTNGDLADGVDQDCDGEE
jgi:hypothetical protein